MLNFHIRKPFRLNDAKHLPNLSSTDGPDGGGCNGACLLVFVSYFEAEYEADDDVAP